MHGKGHYVSLVYSHADRRWLLIDDLSENLPSFDDFTTACDALTKDKSLQSFRPMFLIYSDNEATRELYAEMCSDEQSDLWTERPHPREFVRKCTEDKPTTLLPVQAFSVVQSNADRRLEQQARYLSSHPAAQTHTGQNDLINFGDLMMQYNMYLQKRVTKEYLQRCKSKQFIHDSVVDAAIHLIFTVMPNDAYVDAHLIYLSSESMEERIAQLTNTGDGRRYRRRTTRNKPPSEANIIVLPMIHPVRHFQLAIVIQSCKVCLIFDSLHIAGDEHRASQRRAITAALKILDARALVQIRSTPEELTFAVVDTPQQQGVDCGLHTIYAARYVATYLDVIAQYCARRPAAVTRDGGDAVSLETDAAFLRRLQAMLRHLSDCPYTKRQLRADNDANGRGETEAQAMQSGIEELREQLTSILDTPYACKLK